MRAIKSAKQSISMQIYGLTDPDLIALLEKKQSQGIDVQIFYDKKASRSLPPHLAAYPIKSSGLMHRKILIIDDTTIFLGTANYTPQSLKMHDNLIVGIWNHDLAMFFKHSSEQQKEFVVDGLFLSAFLLPDFEKKAIEALTQRIDAAKESIQIAMFTLTHPTIREKLMEAKKRGVSVSVAIDRYTALGASKKHVEALKDVGVEIRKSGGSQLLHHKWALIDNKTFIIGSANWTGAAFEKNQDCLLIFDELKPSHQKILLRIWKAVAIASQKG